MITNWKEDITGRLKYNNESWNDVESCTLTEEQLNKKFDNSYGCTNGEPFTVWTKNKVYFPVQYDGAEWVASVSRNPDGKSTNHVGGG